MQVPRKIPPLLAPTVSLAPSVSRRTVNATLILLLLISAVYLCLEFDQEDDSSTFTDTASAQLKAEQLDLKYTSHLMPHSHSLQSPSDMPASSVSATIVLGRRANETERVQWVYDKLHNIVDPQIYVVDDPDARGPHLKHNHGRESAVYLSYIVENYDRLHDITFFWHNEEQVWHNNMLLGWDSVVTINRMNRQHILDEGYVPSRCDHWPGCPQWIRFNPAVAEHRSDPHRLENMFHPDLFHSLFPNSTEFPPYFSGTCCSQFAASRDTIRSRPLQFYERLLAWILEFENDEHSGTLLEYLWPYILLGRGTLCPTMDECYCKTYNFCMRNPADIVELQHWNDLRTRREELKWQLNFTQEAQVMAQVEVKEMGGSSEEIRAAGLEYEEEIERLTADFDQHAQQTWNVREQIVHRWRLPVPPTGW